jgi:hypothetical protein
MDSRCPDGSSIAKLNWIDSRGVATDEDRTHVELSVVLIPPRTKDDEVWRRSVSSIEDMRDIHHKFCEDTLPTICSILHIVTTLKS